MCEISVKPLPNCKDQQTQNLFQNSFDIIVEWISYIWQNASSRPRLSEMAMWLYGSCQNINEYIYMWFDPSQWKGSRKHWHDSIQTYHGIDADTVVMKDTVLRPPFPHNDVYTDKTRYLYWIWLCVFSIFIVNVVYQAWCELLRVAAQHGWQRWHFDTNEVISDIQLHFIYQESLIHCPLIQIWGVLHYSYLDSHATSVSVYDTYIQCVNSCPTYNGQPCPVIITIYWISPWFHATERSSDIVLHPVYIDK